MSLKIVFVCAIMLMALSIASAESVSLPINSVKKPANDLVSSSGQPIDAMEAAQRAARKEDLSLLNPADNKFWQNRVYSIDDSAERSYPRGENGVVFLSDEAQLPFTYMARVQSSEDPNQYYRFSLSRYSHSVLLRAALLRKLGYFVPSPKYYKNLKIRFESEEQKEQFLKTAQETMISDFDSRGWITQNDKINHTLTFSDALLEPSENEFFDIQWGYAPDPNNPAQLPIVQRFSKYRAYRALIVPFAFVDVPESINRFANRYSSILSGHVVINHPSAESFSAATFEDVRWLLLRMKRWVKEDYRQVVLAGQFPPELNDLLTTKLMYRAENAFEQFDIQDSSISERLPSLDITSPGGLVRNGKVVREMVPGYPQRFAHGDRESPFKDGDFERYLGIRARTAAISTAMNEINKKLEVLTVEKLFENRRQTIIDRIRKHIQQKPLEPLYQDVEAWGGPVGGFNLAATRHVSTGTYYGSSAPIQMVDNISVSANLGWMMMVDGVPKVTPNFGANVQVLRDYTHVRPLMSITEGSKVEWKDLAIPWFMKSISKVLARTDLVTSNDPEKPARHPVDEFLMELRDGEVFTVTDSVTLSAYIQASSSFDVLMGIAPLGYINSISAGADGARVILRQTSFMRTKDGIQVYVRSQKTSAFGLTLDVNYFVNLLRVRASTQVSELSTDVFVIDYNPELAAYIDTNSEEPVVKDFIETRKNLKPALWSLFQSNETELLYARFKYKKFDVDHNLKTKEVRTRFLAWRLSDYNEDHTVKILYPRSEANPDLDPENEAVILFSAKRGELKGRDLMGFATGWLESLFDKFVGKGKTKVDLAGIEDPNPANLPYGKAYWRTINTEVDLSPNTTQYPNISILQHVWGGWHLSGKDFRRLLAEIDEQFRGTGLAAYRLVDPQFFHNTTAIDFYRITASLSILPSGVDRIRDLITQPDADGKKLPPQGAVGRFFRKIAMALGSKSARVHDKEMYNEVLQILGNGNQRAGEDKLKEECQARNHNKENHDTYSGTNLNGTYYECMTPWMQRLLELSRNYPKYDKKGQARWTSEVVFILDEHIPMPQLLKYLGPKNYIFLIRVNGFRSGEEDGDLEYFSNTLGDPTENFEYANGLINMYAGKTRISPIELDRTQAGFR